MNEMIERVAKAIGKLPLITSNTELAKAAIAAMREPTEEMILAGDSDVNGRGNYKNMIDAALKD